MTVGTTKKTETKKFTYLAAYRFSVQEATGPEEIEKENCPIIIIEGTAGAIGAKRVESTSGIEVGKVKLQEGDICTLEVGDPVVIAKATYLGEVTLEGGDFLAWKKKGVRFWTYKESTLVTHIGGKRV